MTSQNRRRFLKLVGATGAAVTLAGCGDGGDTDDGGNGGGTDGTDEMNGQPEDNETDGGEMDGNETEDGEEDGNETEDGDGEAAAGSNLRVAHLSPDAPNVDVYVDEEPVLEDLPFGEFSDYLPLEPGTYGVQITAAGDPETVVFDEDVELLEGSFTAAALGELEETNQPFAVEVFEDDLSDPGEQARVRAIHASPDAPNVDITAAGAEEPLFTDVAFGTAGATTVPAGAYTLEIRAAGQNGEPVATFDVDLAAGTVYTAAAAGYLEPEMAPANAPFDLLVVTDSEGEMTNGGA